MAQMVDVHADADERSALGVDVEMGAPAAALGLRRFPRC
jgi:hypothetical protein